MSDYLYRGTSLTGENQSVYEDGIREGITANIYKGELDTEYPQQTQPRDLPIEELPWWKPEGEHRGYFTEQTGVTGGLTHTLGTAIGFSTGIKTVLYLRERDLNGTGITVRYGYDFLDSVEGAATYIFGDSIDGEIRTINDGLIGLTTMGDQGPKLWYWGKDDINSRVMGWQDEREVLVLDDHADLGRALESVAIFGENQVTANRLLANMDGYYSGYGSDGGIDVSGLDHRQAARHLHDAYQSEAKRDLADLWYIYLDKTILGDFGHIPEDTFGFAFDGDEFYEERSSVPAHLLGLD